MCSMSVILDYGQTAIPYKYQQQTVPWSAKQPVAEGVDNETLREILRTFRALVAPAKAFDDAAQEPDCEDPEKAKLLDRVAELERRLAVVEAT